MAITWAAAKVGGYRPRYDPIAENIRTCIHDGDDGTAKTLIASTDIRVLDCDARTPLVWASFHHRGGRKKIECSEQPPFWLDQK